MHKNILPIIVIITIIASPVAIAGRHGIAREEASRIVDNRFAQFYRDEAERKQAEQRAMDQEITKAKELEAAMLRELEQDAANQNKIKSADELEQSIQRELAALNHNTPYNIDHNDVAGINHNRDNIDHSAANVNSASREDHTFFDLKSGSKENNPFLFLQDLHHADPLQRAAGIQEVLESLNSLPDNQKLSEEFIRDLTKISPAMAREFSAAYKSSLANNKATTKKNSKRSAQSNNPSGNDNNSQSKEGTVVVADEYSLKHPNQEQFRLKEGKLNQTFNAVTNYSFSQNKLYQIYAAPHKVTVIVLAPGEKIVGHPICGDPVRWKLNTISDTSGNTRSHHLTIQPLRAGITTSITIATNQGRIYLLEATSLKNNYMAIVRWSYGE